MMPALLPSNRISPALEKSLAKSIAVKVLVTVSTMTVPPVWFSNAVLETVSNPSAWSSVPPFELVKVATLIDVASSIMRLLSFTKLPAPVILPTTISMLGPDPAAPRVKFAPVSTSKSALERTSVPAPTTLLPACMNTVPFAAVSVDVAETRFRSPALSISPSRSVRCDEETVRRPLLMMLWPASMSTVAST